MDKSLKKFIEGMPKVELHLHIEGSLEPEMMWKLAKRNHVVLKKKDGTPYANVDEIKAAYQFNNLQEFLDLYYSGMSVLKTEQDFEDLTYAYMKKIASQNVKHTEIFFDPQGHTERGVPFDTAINGIKKGLAKAKADFGVSSKLIMSFLRHMSEEEGFKTLEQAKPYIERGEIDGFGLDSSEKGHPPSKFERLYNELRKTKLPLMAHAGEEGPPEYVHEALDLLKIDRIDHGNRSLEDEALTQKLAKMKIGLTVCPLSNLKLCGVKDMKDHPLKKMLEKGLMAGVNSDDPAYFGGYMNENFIAVAEALNLTREDIMQLASNAIETSFLFPSEKWLMTRELNEYALEFEAKEASASQVHELKKKLVEYAQKKIEFSPVNSRFSSYDENHPFYGALAAYVSAVVDSTINPGERDGSKKVAFARDAFLTKTVIQDSDKEKFEEILTDVEATARNRTGAKLREWERNTETAYASR